MNIPRNKKFYEHGEWLKILADKPITKQPESVLKKFIRESIEDSHRWRYYRDLEFMEHQGPDWEDLTDDQRENIREILKKQDQAMQEFGKAIANGTDINQAGRKLIE